MPRGERIGEFEIVVLLAVARLGERAYGMAIRREILDTTGRDVTVPAVYVTLDRLGRKGMLSSSKGEATPERGGRAKRFYALEPEGARALHESRRVMDALWSGVDLSAWGV
jgi:DNA-binding PadR family transcriptional regulator